ncbi:MAG: GTPase-associated system all-helical protein GASH [Komagataeibacter saccharivorans]|uniref:GTPase-associated system all-helical protein GASH n=1 Tax=Komagataeibacter saccharivorans TaxID=265959 RepID=UPI0039E8BB32
MTDNIPVHLRITGLIPSNDDVDSRRLAVADLAKTWGEVKKIGSIVSKAAAIAASLGGDGRPDGELGTEVQGAVQKYASAFLYEDRPLEVGVCAGLAAVAMLAPDPASNGWTIQDVYSNSLWSALAFQPVLEDGKRENLRREVLDRARRRSLDSAERARERDAVPDPVDLVVMIGEEDKVTTNFKKAALDAIEALRRNSALDREELDFLWWSQLSRSRLLDRPLSALSEAVKLVGAGIEASNHLRRLPAGVHRDLVLRTVDTDPEFDLPELMAEIGGDRAPLAAGVHASSNVTAHPTVFPLLNAIVTGNVDVVGSEIKRKASTWGARALLESALSRNMATGIIKQ